MEVWAMFAWGNAEIDWPKQRQHEAALMASLLAKGFHPQSYKLRETFRKKRRWFYK
jgi:hypothetical protein